MTARLDFLDSREGLRPLIEALDGATGKARFVGGMVRDAMLGIDAADVDVATVFAPDEVMRRLRNAGIKAVPTGIAHGTVTAVLPLGPVEVTTLRRDVSTDGRHAVVVYTDDWREDAARRDFTINALYSDPLTGEVFDYFGGLDDLAVRRVRFIGDPYQRIAEDHLRILRFFRFHARFGDAIDDAGLDACVARANDLMALSRERIAAELLKLLVAPSAVPVMALMIERGVLKPVLPEIRDTARFVRAVRREQRSQFPHDALLRLVSLLPDGAVDEIGARLKLSNADRRRMTIAASPMTTGNPRELAYRLGIVGARDQLLLSDLSDDEVSARWSEIDGWPIPRLPLSGGALVARGLSKGPQVARALRSVEDEWIAEGFPDEQRVGALADAAVAQALHFASRT